MSGPSSVPAGGGPWAVFGWVMISLAAALAVVIVLALILFLGEPVPPTGT